MQCPLPNFDLGEAALGRPFDGSVRLAEMTCTGGHSQNIETWNTPKACPQSGAFETRIGI
jgi:hypothetical protein